MESDTTMTAGRKRAFDKTEALDKAMRVFWENGYSATSVSDLTEVLGINKPSLYAAFGNKEQLFATALEHYMSHYGAPLMERLTQPEDAPLADRIRAYMLGIIDLVNSKESPKGCLFVKSSCEAGGSALPEDVSQSLRVMRQVNEKRLTRVLETERKRGLLPATAKPRDIAEYLVSVLYGLSVLSKQGKSRSELIRIVDIAINALPTPDG
ncbi:MAG: TetR/AcrR family transcriptional regulator [Candidatus Thiodiazotropha sp. (ex Ctena orbiculata)]|uniref:TetR/AcrR family transcriptional regulator n=1 Tax=Candidatus Thiodiazotropha taylori TaxID=2792791 RepID=A0A944M9F6_9GAMM|nr:TetR/AcrR family transcriptional regulator [Candidatus Thiodiazotropha taylori]MBV2136093.1 TetR/AcrR family transcriptional regulator [Candidatus Thiodiazotropha taylori]